MSEMSEMSEMSSLLDVQSNEFIPALAKFEPVYKEEEEAFLQW